MSATGASEAQNIAVVRRGYEAFAKGDIETLKTLFSTNATWHSVETGILPGNYRGVQAILEFFGRLVHETDGTARAELQTLAASGDHVFALHRNKGKRKGKTLDEKSVLVFKLDKGVVSEVAEFRFDQPTEAKFWA
jgi:ketosteroid isomerase-like protein